MCTGHVCAHTCAWARRWVRGLDLCRWEFLEHHPLVSPASLVPSTSSPVPRPRGSPWQHMWNRLQERPWDPQGWDTPVDTGRKSMSLLSR